MSTDFFLPLLVNTFNSIILLTYKYDKNEQVSFTCLSSRSSLNDRELLP